MADFLRLSLTALALTLAVEVGVAFLFGLRGKRELGAVVAVNIITNPLLNYFVVAGAYFHLISPNSALILLLEVFVVLVEWRLLVYALREDSKRMFALSALMNAASFVVGILFFKSIF